MSERSQYLEQVFVERFSPENLGPDHIAKYRVHESDIQIARPGNIEGLIDSVEVERLFREQNYMPYWANVWPVSLILAERILRSDVSSFESCLELGSGLGLAGISALMKGLPVTFSDYDKNALDYSRKNVELNQLSGATYLELDWRNPIDQKFDFIIGADLAWDQSLVPCLVRLFTVMLRPDGVVWLADQNRIQTRDFSQMLHNHGFDFATHSFAIDPSLGWDISGSIYEIRFR